MKFDGQVFRLLSPALSSTSWKRGRKPLRRDLPNEPSVKCVRHEKRPLSSTSPLHCVSARRAWKRRRKPMCNKWPNEPHAAECLPKGETTIAPCFNMGYADPTMKSPEGTVDK